VNIFPREVDFAEWETLRRYPLLNWNMGMVYRLIERDERIYPQGELARRTIGLTGDKGNYGIEEAYREELAGRDGKALRQRIARGFYGRVAGGDHEDPVDGFDIVTTLDLDLQDVADKALRRQLEAQNALWGTTIVMEVRRAKSWRWSTSAAMPTGVSPNGRTTPWAAAWSRVRRSSWRRCSRCSTTPGCPSRRFTTPHDDVVVVRPARHDVRVATRDATSTSRARVVVDVASRRRTSSGTLRTLRYVRNDDVRYRRTTLRTT